MRIEIYRLRFIKWYLKHSSNEKFGYIHIILFTLYSFGSLIGGIKFNIGYSYIFTLCINKAYYTTNDVTVHTPLHNFQDIICDNVLMYLANKFTKKTPKKTKKNTEIDEFGVIICWLGIDFLGDAHPTKNHDHKVWSISVLIFFRTFRVLPRKFKQTQ